MIVGIMVGIVRTIHFQFVEPTDDLLRNVIDNVSRFLKP